MFPPGSAQAFHACGADLMLTVVISRPAELSEGVRNVRTRSAGVAVHGGCVLAVLTQLEFTMRG